MIVTAIATPTPTRYPMARVGGLFILCVGLGLLAAALLDPAGLISRPVFFLGVAAAGTSLSFAPKLTEGRPTRIQIAAMAAGIILEIVLLAALPRLLGPTDPRTFWLWTLLIVGLHFLPLSIAFGPEVLALGLLCMANAAGGLVAAAVSLRRLGIADGVLKTAIGAWMMRSRP